MISFIRYFTLYYSIDMNIFAGYFYTFKPSIVYSSFPSATFTSLSASVYPETYPLFSITSVHHYRSGDCDSATHLNTHCCIES